MKQIRGCHAAVSIGELIFVIGGYSNSSKGLKSMEMYDSRSNNWIEITSMNTERYLLAAAICGNSIFAIGGYDGIGLKTVEKLSIF